MKSALKSIFFDFFSLVQDDGDYPLDDPLNRRIIETITIVSI